MSRPRNLPRRLLASLATVGMGAALAAYVWHHRDSMTALFSARPVYLIVVLAMLTLRDVARAFVELLMLRPRQIRLGGWECWWLTAAASAADVFLPEGGTALRAMYLKRRHGLGYLQYLQAMLGLIPPRWTIDLALMAVCFVPGMLALGWRPIWVAAFTGAIALVVATVWHGLPHLQGADSRLAQMLRGTIGSWLTLRARPRLLWPMCGLLLAVRLLQALVFWAAAQAAGVELSFGQALAISIATILATAVNIVPGGLGVIEAVAAVSGAVVGLSPVECVAIALLSRMAGLVQNMATGPVATWYLSRQSQRVADADSPGEEGVEHAPGQREERTVRAA